MVSVLPPGSFKILALTLWSCGFTRVCLCRLLSVYSASDSSAVSLLLSESSPRISECCLCASSLLPTPSRPTALRTPDSFSLLNLACLLCVCSRDNVFKYIYLVSMSVSGVQVLSIPVCFV